MARLSRISPVGTPVHIIQRGNNRQALFCFGRRPWSLCRLAKRIQQELSGGNICMGDDD